MFFLHGWLWSILVVRLLEQRIAGNSRKVTFQKYLLRYRYFSYVKYSLHKYSQRKFKSIWKKNQWNCTKRPTSITRYEQGSNDTALRCRGQLKGTHDMKILLTVCMCIALSVLECLFSFIENISYKCEYVRLGHSFNSGYKY